MKLLLTTMTSLLMAGAVFCQKCSVEISPEFKTNRDKYLWNHLYSDAGGHYILLVEENRGFFQYKKFTPTLQKYDRTFNLNLDQEIQVEGSDIEFDDMVYAQQKFVLGTRNNDKKAGKVTITATVVGLDARVQQSRKVATIPYKSKDEVNDMVKWKVSEDTSKILLAAWAEHSPSKLQAIVTIVMLDNNLDETWKKSFTIPYKQENFRIKDFIVSNTGQVYFSAKVYFDKKDIKKGEPSYKMAVFSIDGASAGAKEITPELPGKFITDLSINVAKDGTFYCAGVYTLDKTGVVQGFFCQQTDGQSGKVPVTQALNDTDIKNFSTEKDKSNQLGLSSAFEMKNLITNADGSMLLLVEDAYTTHESYTSGANMKTITIYNTDDLMVIRISPQGTVEWLKKVPKSQAFAETEKYSSYAYMVSGGNVCLVYNDDKDNVTAPVTAKAKRISSFKDAVAGMFTINGAGKMERQKVFSIKKDSGTLLVPEKCAQISDKELFFVTEGTFKITGKNMYRIGVVRME